CWLTQMGGLEGEALQDAFGFAPGSGGKAARTRCKKETSRGPVAPAPRKPHGLFWLAMGFADRQRDVWPAVWCGAGAIQTRGGNFCVVAYLANHAASRKYCPVISSKTSWSSVTSAS